MPMSPVYLCGKLCSTGTHNETMKTTEKPAHAFHNRQWNYDGITASNLEPVEVFSILQLNLKFYLIDKVT